MSPICEFVITGVPVSQQTRNRQLIRQWSKEVRCAAAGVWGGHEPYTGDVMVTITYFFDSGAKGVPDVDNIPKPIVDSLKNLVLSDDDQVSDILCRKRSIGSELVLHNPSPTLLRSFAQPDPFLHILVSEASLLELTF